MVGKRGRVLIVAVSCAGLGCTRAASGPRGPTAEGDTPPPDRARVLLVAEAHPEVSKADVAAYGRHVKVRIYDEHARVLVDVAPGSHAIVDLPAGEHLLAAAAHEERGPVHAACVGALDVDVVPGRLYAARVRVGPYAEIDGPLAKRSRQCTRVAFARVLPSEVASLVTNHPLRTAERRPVGTPWAYQFDGVDHAELVTGIARLRTVHDDHDAMIARAPRFVGYEASPAPRWSAEESSLGREDGIDLPVP